MFTSPIEVPSPAQCELEAAFDAELFAEQDAYRRAQAVVIPAADLRTASLVYGCSMKEAEERYRLRFYTLLLEDEGERQPAPQRRESLEEYEERRGREQAEEAGDVEEGEPEEPYFYRYPQRRAA